MKSSWLTEFRATSSCSLSCQTLCLTLLFITSALGSNPLRYRVIEELPGGTIIASLIQDLGLRRQYSPDVIEQLEFNILTQTAAASVAPESIANRFEIGRKTGVLAVGPKPLDRDEMTICKDRDICDVTLDISIKPAQYFQIVKIAIEIADINDHSPQFTEAQATVRVRESSAVGSGTALPVATDFDSPSNGIKHYELRSDDLEALRSLELRAALRRDGTLDPRLVVRRPLDREKIPEYRFQLIAYDGGSPPKSAIMEITVVVVDSNDNSPIFDQRSYSVNVSENTPVGTKILRVRATDNDIEMNGAILYRFSPQTRTLYGHLFSLDEHTGELVVRGEIDYEKHPVLQLSVIAQDQGPDSIPVDVPVIVRVLDVNDNPPSVTINTLRRQTSLETGESPTSSPVAEVMENHPPGAFVAHVSVLDPDSGDSGKVDCNLTSSEAGFRLVERYEKEFQVMTGEMMDRERRDEYRIEVVCGDSGKPRLITRKVVTVRVSDVNDNAPSFSSNSYSTRITEGSHAGTAVLQLTATDPDKGPNSEFHFLLDPGVSGMFEISPGGTIVARSVVDREEASSYSFTVAAVDHGSPPLTATALVRITIDDINDQAPTFPRSGYTFSVPEGEPEGTAVGRVLAEDLDAPPNNILKYSFYPEGQAMEGGFKIDEDTGNIYTVARLDREKDAVYLLMVMARDGGTKTLTGTTSVTIFIHDKNDNSPSFEFPRPNNDTLTISNLVPLGEVIGRVIAYDIDTDNNARIRYELINGGGGAFSIEPLDGAITVNVRLAHVDLFTYELNIQASDQGTPSRWVQAHLRICVNSSVPYTAGGLQRSVGDDPDGESTFNLAVIIALASGSSIIIVILLILIAAVRQHSRYRRSERYKTRMEALKALTAQEAASGRPLDGADPFTEVPKHDGDGVIVKNGCLKVNGTKTNGCLKANGKHKVITSDQHIPLRHHTLADTVDLGSTYSAEGSNADSGHVGYEEDDRPPTDLQGKVRRIGSSSAPAWPSEAGNSFLPAVVESPRTENSRNNQSAYATTSRALRHALPPPPPPRIAQFHRMHIYDESGSVGGTYATMPRPSSCASDCTSDRGNKKYESPVGMNTFGVPNLNRHSNKQSRSNLQSPSGESIRVSPFNSVSRKTRTENGAVWKLQEQEEDGFVV